MSDRLLFEFCSVQVVILMNPAQQQGIRSDAALHEMRKSSQV